MADRIERFLDFKLADGVDRRVFLKLGVTAAGMAAVAACGGSTTAGPSGPTGPEFKLGVVLPYSGVYAELGKSITNGMQMYFDSVGNQAGNRKITMVTSDEQTALADAVAATKKVVEQDAVDMVSGYVSSPNAAGNRDYLDGQKMPTLIANAGVNSLSRAAKSPFIYRTSFSNWQPSHPMGSYVAEKLGKKKIQLVYAKYGAGLESVASFKETFTAAGGTIVGPDVATPFPNNGDQTPFVQAIKTDAIDGIYCFMSGTDAVTFLKKANELGTLKKLGLVSGSGFFVEQDVLAAITDAAPVGAITGLHWALTLATKENQDFVSKYSKKFSGRQADVFAVQGFDTARVIVEALNAVKGKTDDKLSFMKAISNVAFKSPRGDFRFDPNTNNVVQTIYVRKTVNDPKLGWTNKVIDQYPGVADPGK
ncbi:MAG TPA: ABC transporter substrate-binding protein [Solirubrobacterales bacterium]|jgi:branched-chain amino acid transport system substrate-binding protein